MGILKVPSNFYHLRELCAWMIGFIVDGNNCFLAWQTGQVKVHEIRYNHYFVDTSLKPIASSQTQSFPSHNKNHKIYGALSHHNLSLIAYLTTFNTFFNVKLIAQFVSCLEAFHHFYLVI